MTSADPVLSTSLSSHENKLAEGRGFEPPVGLPPRLISSQVPLTTQPPFRFPCVSIPEFASAASSVGPRGNLRKPRKAHLAVSKGAPNLPSPTSACLTWKNRSASRPRRK